MTCISCNKNFNIEDIEKVIDIFPNEEGLCLKCIIKNLPSEEYLYYENTCEKCNEMYNYWSVKIRGICIDENVCEDCHVKNMIITLPLISSFQSSLSSTSRFFIKTI